MYSYLDPNGNTFWCAEDIGVNTIVPANWVLSGGWSIPNATDNLKFIGFANPGGSARIDIPTTAYELYKLSFTVSSFQGPAYSINITNGTFINTIIFSIGGIGVYELYFIPNGVTSRIIFSPQPPTGGSDTVIIENISFDLLNVNLPRDRMRCSNIIIDPCNGSPGGGGLQGDCGETAINNGLILCEPEDSWNCNLCGNDLPYYNPVLVGDPFVFQFQQWDYVNGQNVVPTFNWNAALGWGTVIEATVYDCCTDTLIDGDVLSFAIENYVGMYNTIGYNGLDNWQNIQQVSLDLETIYNSGLAFNPLWDGCFYIKFTFVDSGGLTINEFYTEPYKFEKCDDTILLEGVFSKKDCFGYWYYSTGRGTPASNIFQANNPIFPYRNTYRVKGSFELSGFEINKEFVGTRQFTANTERQELWLFRTNRIPSRVARLISNILAAETVYVDGRDYIASGTINKNNETGNQWFLESQLKRVTCSQTSSCD